MNAAQRTVEDEHQEVQMSLTVPAGLFYAPADDLWWLSACANWQGTRIIISISSNKYQDGA